MLWVAQPMKKEICIGQNVLQRIYPLLFQTHTHTHKHTFKSTSPKLQMLVKYESIELKCVSLFILLHHTYKRRVGLAMGKHTMRVLDMQEDGGARAANSSWNILVSRTVSSLRLHPSSFAPWSRWVCKLVMGFVVSVAVGCGSHLMRHEAIAFILETYLPHLIHSLDCSCACFSIKVW